MPFYFPPLGLFLLATLPIPTKQKKSEQSRYTKIIFKPLELVTHRDTYFNIYALVVRVNR